MSKLTLEVPNIGCDGCVKAIQLELGELPGVARVDGDVASRMIQVEFNAPASHEQIVEALKQIDYPAAH